MSKHILADIGGSAGIIASVALNASIGEDINRWLTVVISLLTIAYMAAKFWNEIRKKKEK